MKASDKRAVLKLAEVMHAETVFRDAPFSAKKLTAMFDRVLREHRYGCFVAAQAAAKRYEPTSAFQNLHNFLPFDAVAIKVYEGILKELEEGTLNDYQRVAFYA